MLVGHGQLIKRTGLNLIFIKIIFMYYGILKASLFITTCCLINNVKDNIKNF